MANKQIYPTYSPEDVEIIFDGVNINSGIAEGTFLTVSRDEDAFFKNVGANGKVARTRNANKSGTIEVTLMQNSEVNRLLMAKAKLDEEGLDLIDVIAVKDPSDPTGTFLLQAGQCWIRKMPDQAYAKEYGDRTWIFDVAYLDISEDVNNLV